MSDVDLSEFYKLSKPKKKPCIVGFSLSQLKPKEKKELESALSDTSGIITNSAIVAWLGKRNFETNPSAVTSHRNRRCSCDES